MRSAPDPPRDTVGPATRVSLLVGRLVLEAYQNDRTVPADPPPPALAAELTAVGDRAGIGSPPDVVARALSAFIHLLGAVSAELFGQLNNTVEERRAFFEYQLRGQAGLIEAR